MDKPRKNGLIRLIEIAGTRKPWLLAAMSLALLATIAQFTPYWAILRILQELALHGTSLEAVDTGLIRFWAWASLGGIVVYGVLFYSANMLSHIAAFHILYEMRMAIARKLVRLPLGFFSRRSSGELKKIMSEDVERVELFVAHHIPDITTAIIFPLLLLGFLLYTDALLALVVLIVFALAISLQATMLSGNKSQETMKAYHASLARMNQSIVEYVRGIQVVKVFSRSVESYRKLHTDIVDFKCTSERVCTDYTPTYTAFLTLLSSTLLFLVPAAWWRLHSASCYTQTLPTVLLFLVLGSGLFFPMLKLMWMGSMLAQIGMGVKAIDEVLDKEEISETAQALTPKDSSIVVNDVSFAYRDGIMVLHHVSFSAEPGTVTALVGPSGSGKSTLAMLIARFWDVASGEIRIGGVALQDMSTTDLMDHVSFVFQDNMLFFDSIAENIRMGHPTATQTDIENAARAAQCHDFIIALDQGYHTLVGEGGTYLSGGEQQRIALARAILKNAPILILDEATAYADPENEGKILEAFSHLIPGKTVLVIAHRLGTIVDAHQILVLDQGKIVERGKHNELLQCEGLYTNMWNTYNRSRNWVLGQGGTP